jgi:RNA polymerase sigma factor (TIGR02999 family)
MDDVTRVLNAVSQGDSSQQNALLESIYAELHAMAARKMAQEHHGYTLQPTALVNEAYLRLAGNDREWQNRRHFFGAAAEAMRRILVEAARKRAAAKRGGGQKDTMFEDENENHNLLVPDERVLEIHEVLDELEREDEIKARIVKLRFFVGLKHREIAELLEISDKTVRRHWEGAKLWLHRAIHSDEESS